MRIVCDHANGKFSMFGHFFVGCQLFGIIKISIKRSHKNSHPFSIKTRVSVVYFLQMKGNRMLYTNLTVPKYSCFYTRLKSFIKVNLVSKITE